MSRADALPRPQPTPTPPSTVRPPLLPSTSLLSTMILRLTSRSLPSNTRPPIPHLRTRSKRCRTPRCRTMAKLMMMSWEEFDVSVLYDFIVSDWEVERRRWYLMPRGRQDTMPASGLTNRRPYTQLWPPWLWFFSQFFIFISLYARYDGASATYWASSLTRTQELCTLRLIG